MVRENMSRWRPIRINSILSVQTAKNQKMKLHTLKPAKGAVHKEKRLGRGEASGHGGTSTKGNKDQQSHTCAG